MVKVRDVDSKRAMVTGGAGFIGSHIVEKLVAEGYQVTAVDTMEWCYPGNLDAAMETGQVILQVADCSADSWEVDGHYDEIYHLAGVVATGAFMKHPISSLMVSILPMQKLLRYKLLRNPEVKLLFASSSEVYGDASVHPQPEDYRGNVSCWGPRSGYDEGKRATESLIHGWEREMGWDCASAIIRIFNTYGPRMTANGRLVPSMALGAIRDGKIMVNAPGTQTRTLQHVSDCIEAMRRACALQNPLAINVGGVETMPVMETAERIAAAVQEITGQEIEIYDGPEVPDEILRRRPDISRAKELLDWEPKVSFADGVKDVISYWQARVD